MSQNAGTVAVVILNYNGKGYLEKFLPPLIAYNDGYSIIVADNASTDDSLTFMENHYPEVSVVKMSENLGFAGGYNEALRQVDSDYYVLLNSDVEVVSGWLRPMIDFLENNPDVAACQPKIKSYHQKSHFEYAGAGGGFLDYYGFPFCRGRIFDRVEEDKGQYDTNRQVFWASGACLTIRSSVFREMDGLDYRFFAHMEEIDLCWRMYLQGYKIFCVPAATVYHVGGGTLSVNSPRKVYLNFRNSLLMLYKNLPQQQFIKKYIARVGFDILAVVNFILTLQFKFIPTIVKAHKDFHQMKKYYDRKGPPLKRNLLKEEKIVYQKSLVWTYFLAGKKRSGDFF